MYFYTIAHLKCLLKKSQSRCKIFVEKEVLLYIDNNFKL